MFRIIVGCIFCLGAVFIGLYVGLYLCLFGGIVQTGTEVMHAINHEDISVSDAAFGIVRVMAAGLCGWISFMLGLSIGVGFVTSGTYSKGWW